MIENSSQTHACNYETIDLTQMTSLSRYKFLTATVVPRPIAMVTTLNEDGTINAAPFSQFVILSANPPMLGIVSGQHPDGIKDTHANISRTGQYVINVVTEDMGEMAQKCAFPFKPDVSEVELLGIDTTPALKVNGHMLSSSPVSFECKLSRIECFGDTATLIAGEVVGVQARVGLVNGHRVDHSSLKPLGRIAGRGYCRTDNVLMMSPDLDADFAKVSRHSHVGKVLP